VSSSRHPGPASAGPGGFTSVGNASAYLDIYDRYHSLLDELVPIANCSGWRTREETHDALQRLVDRVLAPRTQRSTELTPADSTREPDQGRDR
jgi:hypothetical protein